MFCDFNRAFTFIITTFLNQKVEGLNVHHKKHELTKVLVSSLCEAIENELKGSGMAISKKSSRVLKVTDVERYKGLIFCRKFDDRIQGGIPNLNLRPALYSCLACRRMPITCYSCLT